MDERILYFRVGIVILAAVIVTGILILLFGLGFQSEYKVYMIFPQAPGVSVDTPVRKSGVLIGRVSEVELLDEGGVRLTADIISSRAIKRSEVPRIGTASLLGDAVVEFVPSDTAPPSVEDYASGDVITNGIVARNPLESLNEFADMKEEISLTMKAVRDAGGSIDAAGRLVGALAENVNQKVNTNEAGMQTVMEKANKALDDFSMAMQSMNKLLGDEELQAELRRSLESFPKLFDEAELTLTSTRETLAGFDRLSAQFERVGASAERNLANLEGFTAPLGERGEEIALKIDRTLTNVDALVLDLGKFSGSLSSNQGSLGLLMNDEELYYKLNRAATNIEDASRQITPILADVRVFTDKIARDPRQLGVKGALDQRPAGAGTKMPISFSPSW
ncbi:MlaD family protein [Lignipirellula cremea]|uniref:Mce related protein n=1 Tax=Lignipirellula cremea TaxID=2528010 RepID=A0A518DUE6_9BACT|nr:MlaD family protein [Lignipirellula cremea]QDU95456.1 mce related protein [Lignipirellula cremea]